METPQISNSTPTFFTEFIKIEKNEKQYILNFKISNEKLLFQISDPDSIGLLSYYREMTLKEIKEIHNIFMGLSTCREFIDFLKSLSDMKKLEIVKNPENFAINFEVEYLLKKNYVQLILLREKINSDKNGKKNGNFEEKIIKIIQEIKDENNNLKNVIESKNKEIQELKKEIKEIKNILEPINQKFKESFGVNKHVFNNNSVIMKENEFDLIHLAIKSRINKEVKELKKLYQATIDGDGPINFHSRCDNIPYTLVLYKSEKNRRFGGFTSIPWSSSSSDEYKDDKNAFLFSLDKQKIYPYNNKGYAICCNKNLGPTFGSWTIGINGNSIQEKKLFVYESSSVYNCFGDSNALCEVNNSYIYALEIEVFQIIFS